ncbi:MAG TPA: ABC transporter permease [Kofleriaceae bacterium]|nr:ABC transporter permease [Kofleriaceae bacterium]
MLRFVLVRIAGGIVVLWAVATFAFFLLHAAPGGPFDDDRELTPDVRTTIEARYHLDEPVAVQYERYLAGLVRLDFGHSMRRPQSVREIIATHAPYSVRLGTLALALALALGVGLGVIAARHRDRAADHVAMTLALVGISVPSFVLGPLLIFGVSLTLFWLPPARLDGGASYVLPATTLALVHVAAIARLTRAGLLETLRQDYIRTARAKGLTERRVVWRHALRVGVMPVVSYLGPATAALLTGSFVVEKIFQIPGLGFSFVASIADRDYPVLTGILVFYTALVVGLNLVVDVLYGVLDPRIREGA